MQKKYVYIAVIVVGIILLMLSINSSTSKSSLSGWYSFEEGLRISKKENKPMFVFISSPNCPFCAKVRDEVLSDHEVEEYIKKNYVPVYIDVGKEKSPIRVFAYPAFVIIYNDKIVDAWGGYASKELFLQKLKSVKI